MLPSWRSKEPHPVDGLACASDDLGQLESPTAQGCMQYTSGVGLGRHLPLTSRHNVDVSCPATTDWVHGFDAGGGVDWPPGGIDSALDRKCACAHTSSPADASVIGAVPAIASGLHAQPTLPNTPLPSPWIGEYVAAALKTSSGHEPGGFAGTAACSNRGEDGGCGAGSADCGRPASAAVDSTCLRSASAAAIRSLHMRR
mmetsp:Transcript_28977/g.88839  ORF Transcript_28977/g.88839 Transcript_28977/m.88839 type:complete len:200 (-) Transcript_28977:522-1121(-)